MVPCGKCFFLSFIFFGSLTFHDRLSCHVLHQADTNLESPDDFIKEGVAGVAEAYNVAPFSSILLKSM